MRVRSRSDGRQPGVAIAKRIGVNAYTDPDSGRKPVAKPKPKPEPEPEPECGCRGEGHVPRRRGRVIDGAGRRGELAIADL